MDASRSCNDPLRVLGSPTASSNLLREGDYFLLVCSDGRQLFAQALKTGRGSSSPAKINKKNVSTANLIGLPYGTVLELIGSSLVPLPPNEDLLPTFSFSVPSTSGPVPYDEDERGVEDHQSDKALEETAMYHNSELLTTTRDNRNFVDSNTSQALNQNELARLRQSGVEGQELVEKIVENSSTFAQKTDFSRQKYVVKKQIKYQLRCRIVKCTGATICEALFLKEPKKIMNLREDTLGQILSFSNVCAGCQVLVYDTCMGIVTGSLAQRMGGYGRILSIYSGQQHSFLDMLERFNLSFSENLSIKWLHSGDVFGNPATSVESEGCLDEEDHEANERQSLEWPCILQEHTKQYIEGMETEKERDDFLAKRAARFARKLARHSPLEVKKMLLSRLSDAVVVVSCYDPTTTLLAMLPYLAASCPFVVYCEFIEPLAECFRELQKQNLAINLRLSDTWARQFQVLPGRTHPHMTMSQSGGCLLTGIKLSPSTGQNEVKEPHLTKGTLAKPNRNRNRRSNKQKSITATSKGIKRATANQPDRDSALKRAHLEISTAFC